MRGAADTDLLILGGGLAGLSLAAGLAESARAPRTLVIEPRDTYSDDRSWCFWADQAEPLGALAERSWPRWSFSGHSDERVEHHLPDRPYLYLRASRVYETALAAMARNPAVSLHTGTRAGALTSSATGFEVETDRGTVRARHVVDTRPPAAGRLDGARLFQCFAGREIKASGPVFETGCAELMGDMRADAHGFAFAYTLPLSPTRALVEATRFAPRRLDDTILEADLDHIFKSRGLDGARVLRREAGVLPMGLPGSPERPGPLVRAGTGGGGLRAASGYGFLRIRSWARVCAASILAGAGPVGHPREPRLRRVMDDLFLKVLQADPERAPGLFMALARSLPADAFVRFMSDEARPADLARVVTCLPPGPFLHAALAGRARQAEAVS